MLRSPLIRTTCPVYFLPSKLLSLQVLSSQEAAFSQPKRTQSRKCQCSKFKQEREREREPKHPEMPKEYRERPQGGKSIADLISRSMIYDEFSARMPVFLSELRKKIQMLAREKVILNRHLSKKLHQGRVKVCPAKEESRNMTDLNTIPEQYTRSKGSRKIRQILQFDRRKGNNRSVSR